MKHIIIFLSLIILSPSAIFGQSKSKSTLIENIGLIDVTNGQIQTKQNILIEEERISIISSDKIPTTEGATIIDGSGKFAMPGMIDTHIHFFQTGSIYTRPDALDLRHIVPYEDEIQFAKDIIADNFSRYLRLGITTVMDVGGPFFNFKVRDSIAKKHLSPNVFLTGPLFSPYQPKAFSKLDDIPIEKINSEEEATALFNKMIAYKPDFIKVWYIVSKDQPADKNFAIVKHIAELSHKHNLKLSVHATQLETAKLAIKAGADILVHSVDNTVVDQEFIELVKSNDVTYIPTLIVSKNYGRSFLATPSNHYQDLEFGHPSVYRSLTDLKKYTDKEVPERIKNLRKDDSRLQAYYKKSDSIMLKNLKTLTESGVNIATGTDAGNIGTLHASSYMQEIETMKLAGIDNWSILKASTINAAKGFGLSENLGSISEDKLADILILDKNPIENLQNLNSINTVIKSGQVLAVDTIFKETPEQLVQRQVNAYNARNIDAFVDTYAEDIKIYNFPNELIMNGKEQLKTRFKDMFDRVPNLYCEIKNRIVLDNKIVDQEYVRFGDKYSNVIAIYEIIEGKISKVTFVR